MSIWSIQICITIFGFILFFMRIATFGSLWMTTLSGITLGIGVVCSAYFVMVFPFAPAVTNITLHSIPYMTYNAAINLFFFYNAILMLAIDNKNVYSTRFDKMVFMAFVIGWNGGVFYGLWFMTDRLFNGSVLRFVVRRYGKNNVWMSQ